MKLPSLFKLPWFTNPISFSVWFWSHVAGYAAGKEDAAHIRLLAAKDRKEKRMRSK